MSMIQRRPDSQRRIRILSKPAPAALVPPPSSSSSPPPEARFKAPGEIEVLVRFAPQAFGHLLAHCAESNEHGREICGLLLGTAPPTLTNQRQGFRLVVTDILPLEASDASGAHVSAPAEAWLQADAEIDERFKGKKRLGWYHTHPTQGIFFSGADKDFHSIFLQPYQFALVVDPRFPELGLFYWQDRPAGLIAGPVPVSPRKTSRLSDLPRPALAGGYRLLLVALGLVGFAGLLAIGRGETGKLLLFSALFIAGLLLRLWNAGFASKRVPRTLELRSTPAAWILALGALLPFFIVGIRLGGSVQVGCARLLQRLQAPSSNTEPSTTQAAVEPPTTETKVEPIETQRPQAATPPEKSSTDPVRESRAVRVWVRSSLISFRWDGGSADYALDSEQKNYRLNSGQETALLGYLLGVSDPWVPEIKSLQEALGVSGPDGAWGNQSRTVLVRVALERASSGRALVVRSADRIYSIAFTKTE